MRIRSLSLGLLLVLALAGSQADAGSITTWTQWDSGSGGNDHWYGIARSDTGGGLNWTDAEAVATSNNGHLVTIDDLNENNWLMSTFPQSTSGILWIGLYAPTGNYWTDLSTWEWVDGSSSTYRKWRTLQPDYGNGNDRYTVLNFSPDGWDNYPHDGWQGAPFGLVERVPGGGSAVPLPASSALALVGLALLAIGRVRRRRMP